MNLSRRVRAGDLIRPGVAGPPPVGLRAFEPVDASPVGVLVRPVGTIVYLRDGAQAWISTVSGWVSMGQLYSGIGVGILLGPSAPDIAAAYLAGWRPPVVVASSSFTGTGVVISGLSAVKRYRITVGVAAEAAAATTLTVQPDGSDANCVSNAILGTYATAFAFSSLVAGRTKANGGAVWEIDIGARTAGLSGFASTCGDDTTMATVIIHSNGATSTDYTSLGLALDVARTNVIYKVVELTP